MTQNTTPTISFLSPVFENIPQELQSRPQWVGWIAVPNEKKPKPDKIPVDTRTGSTAYVNRPNTWSSYSEAVKFYQNKIGTLHTVITKKGPRTGPVAGVGFVMAETDSYVGIDIDDCIRPDGNLTPFAEEIINRVGSYTEISPSGTGIRIFVKGMFPKDGDKDSKLGLEVYAAKHYLTLTGRARFNVPIQENQAALDWLYQQYCHKEKPTQPTQDVAYVSQLGVALTQEDESLREIMCTSHSGPKVKSLYFDGDLSLYDNDHSSADMALCCILAFWCQKDPLQIDRLFRSSALMRDKWDEMRGQEAYGAMTIRKAIESTTEVYSGRGQEAVPATQELIEGKVFMPPPVPLEVFPPQIATLLQEAAEAFTVPLQIAVACLLGLLSCLVGGTRHISIRPSWMEPGIIWLATVASSGIGKSPCAREFFSPIKKLELKSFREWQKQQAIYEDALFLYNKRKKDEVIRKPVPPKRRQAYVDDTTSEALGDALVDNPRGITMLTDELSSMIDAMGQYKAKGNKDGFRSRLLSAYDGNEWKTNRATDPSKNRHIPHAYVGIFGGIQPAMLPKMFEAGETGVDEASGFIQRFMFTYAEREKPSYWTEKYFSPESRASLDFITNYLWSWDIVLDEYGQQIKSVVRVTDEAKAAFINWFNVLSEEEFFSKNPSQLSKLKGQAQRLILLLHCLDAPFNKTDGMNPIPESTMLRGLMLADWLKEHQKLCWNLFSPNRQRKQPPPLERAIMQVIVNNTNAILKNGGKIANSILIPQVRTCLDMPDLYEGRIGKAASALGLASYSDGGRGRIVTEEKVNEFRATVGTVDTVSSLTVSTGNEMEATVPVPSATVGSNESPRQIPTVADNEHTVSVPLEILTALGCSTVLTVTTVPPAVRENFEAAMHSFNTRYNVPTCAM